MIYRISDNILSPLGETTQQNYAAVKVGRTQLCRYESYPGIPEPFTASLFTNEQNRQLALDGLTRFESLAYASARKAIQSSGIDATAPNVVLILSTTKGNIELISGNLPDNSILYPCTAAQHVAQRLGITTTPITVCNACISGVCAQIEAMRALRSGCYDYAVVIGADEQSPFIISGFLSFKALTDTPCRPFDKDRTGLNLGECAATVVLKAVDDTVSDGWVLQCGAIRNDANHISGPSRTGEGSYLALMEVLKESGTEGLAFLNVHGTATAYNDEMESIAIYRAGLIDIPVTGLKGYYGHTMGAAGIMESILSMYAVQDGTVLATRGYAEQGVTYPVNVSSANRPATGNRFIKLLSGFGGCNAALSYAYLKD